MPESKRGRRRRAKGIKEQMFLNSRISKFGRAALAVWDKPAVILHQRAGISVRNANQIIEGTRRVSTRALLALLNEIS